jgi:hypothetical protein
MALEAPSFFDEEVGAGWVKRDVTVNAFHAGDEIGESGRLCGAYGNELCNHFFSFDDFDFFAFGQAGFYQIEGIAEIADGGSFHWLKTCDLF